MIFVKMTTDSNDLTCISPNTIPYEELVKIQGSITAAIVVSVFYKDDRWQVTLPGGIDAFKCKWAGTDIVIGDHFENQICAIYKKKNLTEFCKDRSKRVRWFYLLNQPSSSDSPCIDYYSSEIDESSQYLLFSKISFEYDNDDVDVNDDFYIGTSNSKRIERKYCY